MTPEKLFARYQELQSYVGWRADDAERVRAAAGVVAAHFPALVQDFYAELQRHPAAMSVVTGGLAQVARLQRTLHDWLIQLFAGPYDADYVARRWKVGWRHVEIGLDQVFTNVALSRLRTGLVRILQEQWPGDTGGLLDTVQSLHKLLDLDLAIIEDAFQAERLALGLKHAHEKALQSERLAAIGQMMAGLVHESGNALARTQACLEMLALEVEDRPAALDLIQRAQKAQDNLRLLNEEVRGYAAPIRLELEDWDVSGIWRQAWQNLAVKRQGRVAEIRENTGGIDLHCKVDAFRLEQVFRNIFENSLAACGDPVIVDVRVSETHMEGKTALHIAVQDNGPGLNSEQKLRIFDPFFTTKSRGTGLGMAIARRMMDAHEGVISVGPGEGGGAEIVILLPRG